jgi:hypothetical protein
VLKIGVTPGLRRHLGDVKLVVEVAVDAKAGTDYCVDRLPGLRQRNWDMKQELARRRIGDDRSLIADDEIVETRLLEVRLHGTEHAAGDDDDVSAACPRPHQRSAGARVEHAVLGDQRPVEVEREGGDVPREALRERERYGAWPPVELTT